MDGRLGITDLFLVIPRPSRKRSLPRDIPYLKRARACPHKIEPATYRWFKSQASLISMSLPKYVPTAYRWRDKYRLNWYGKLGHYSRSLWQLSSAIPSLKRADVWSSDRQVMVATPPRYQLWPLPHPGLMRVGL